MKVMNNYNELIKDAKDLQKQCKLFFNIYNDAILKLDSQFHAPNHSECAKIFN